MQRAQARPPTEPEVEEALQRWSRAQPAQRVSGSIKVVIFTKVSNPPQTFSCSWKGPKTSAERDVDSHVFLRKLEKELKVSAERDTKSNVSPWKLEKFRLDR